MDGVERRLDEMELPDLDLLAELTHPIRSRVLRSLDQPRTVAEVASRLAVPVTRLYHHVNRLESLGLIKVVATRRVGAATERRYQTVAASFRIARQLRESSDPQELGIAVGALFDVAKMSYQRDVEQRATRDPLGAVDSFLTLSDLKLTPSARAHLLDRLRALVEEFGRLDDGGKDDGDEDEDEDTSAFTLFIAATPGSI